MQPFVRKDQLILSIVAGITMQTIADIVGNDKAIVRVMPNLAAQTGESMSGWVKNKNITDAQGYIVKTILQAIGKEIMLSHEDQLNAVTAISGSGPAYFFYVAELLEHAGKTFGLPSDIASSLVRQTVIGTASLLQQSSASAEDFRKSVTSKGGTTEAAFTIFTADNFQKIFTDGVKAVAERAKELNK